MNAMKADTAAKPSARIILALRGNWISERMSYYPEIIFLVSIARPQPVHVVFSGIGPEVKKTPCSISPRR